MAGKGGRTLDELGTLGKEARPAHATLNKAPEVETSRPAHSTHADDARNLNRAEVAPASSKVDNIAKQADETQTSVQPDRINPYVNETLTSNGADLSKLGHDFPLSLAKVEEIIATPKGQRPDPSTYLPKEYIDNHLEQFKDGLVRIVSEDKFKQYGLAQVDGTSFMLTKTDAENTLKNLVTTNDMEKFLGLPPGQLDYGGNSVLRIDIPYDEQLNLRIPSGNEAGANSQWIPGGKLPAGGREAVIDASPLLENNDFYINTIKLKGISDE